MRHRSRRATGAVAMTLLLAACGGGDDSGSADDAADTTVEERDADDETTTTTAAAEAVEGLEEVRAIGDAMQTAATAVQAVSEGLEAGVDEGELLDLTLDAGTLMDDLVDAIDEFTPSDPDVEEALLDLRAAAEAAEARLDGMADIVGDPRFVDELRAAGQDLITLADGLETLAAVMDGQAPPSDEGASATFEHPGVGFTFSFPGDFEQVDEPDDGSVIATVTPEPGDVQNAIKISQAAARELAFESYADTIRTQFEQDLGTTVGQAIEQHSGLEMGLLSWSAEGLESDSYFFAASGRTWHLECLSTEEHRAAIDAACAEVVDSITPTG